MAATALPSPAISVAMSVYNSARFLAPAIESILSQTFTDFELLVLDDGSTDASRAVIEGYAARDSRITLISRENRGLVASLNQLLATARAPIIARMDADDISLPTRFAQQYAFLAANPDHGVVGCRTEDMDDFNRPWPCPGPLHTLTHEGILAAIDRDEPILCHPSVMFRREVVLSVGGYHGAFRHCEDYDLWLRLATVTRMANLPEKLIRYRHYPEQVSSRHATEQQVGAAIAKLAYYERRAGRPDPTEHLERLPPLSEVDALFGREGAARAVRARVAPGLLYSTAGLGGDGFDLVLQYLREGGAHDGMWRTVARLTRFGMPARALRLAATLATS